MKWKSVKKLLYCRLEDLNLPSAKTGAQVKIIHFTIEAYQAIRLASYTVSQNVCRPVNELRNPDFCDLIFYGRPWETVPELLLEKKGLIAAL